MVLLMQKYIKVSTDYIIKRLEYFSEISKDIAQIFFGVFAVESLTKDSINWHLFSYGVLLSIMWWSLGIISYRIK